MNLHVSVLEFMVFAAYAIIFGFLWRSLAVKSKDSSLGKAMAYIY